MMIVWAGLLSAGALATEGDASVNETAQRRIRGMVSSCRNSTNALNASGRVEIDAQAHAGQLVSLMIHSEVGDTDLVDCFCSRAPVALREWSESIETDELLTLSLILTPENGGDGAAGSRETHNCRLQQVQNQVVEAPELELPPGSVSIQKLRAKGGLDSDVLSTFLGEHWAEVERCYRADLIRYSGYETTANLEFTVNPDGSTSAMRFEGVAYNSISNCQVQHLMSLSFPENPEASQVKVKMTYTPGD